MTKEEQDNLVVSNLNLARFLTNKLWNTFLPLRYKFDSWEDAYQTGLIALIRASKDFDPSKGTKFSTFACIYIKNRLVGDCRKKLKDSLKFVKNTDLVGGETHTIYGEVRDNTIYEEINQDPRSGQDIENYDNKEEAEFFLSKCTEEQKQIIRDYFYEGKTYRQLSKGSESGKERYRNRVISTLNKFKDIQCLRASLMGF